MVGETEMIAGYDSPKDGYFATDTSPITDVETAGVSYLLIAHPPASAVVVRKPLAERFAPPDPDSRLEILRDVVAPFTTGGTATPPEPKARLPPESSTIPETLNPQPQEVTHATKVA